MLNRNINKFVLLTIVTVFFIAGSISSVLAQPKMLLNDGKDKHNWGKVKGKMSPLKADIQIKNTGTDTLKISNVKPSCGCTSAPLDKDKLAPGEIATLKVSLNLPAGPGNFTKSITITSNDPTNGTKVFMLEGELVKPLVAEPNMSFMFNDLKVGNEATSKLNLRNATDKDITITEATVYPADFKTNLAPKSVIKAGQSREIVVTYTPQKPGFINMSVVLKTDYADDPDMTVTGYGEVKENPLFPTPPPAPSK